MTTGSIGTTANGSHGSRLPIAVAPFILPFMSLKNATVLARVGMILLTVLVAADFVNTLSGVLRDIIPALALLRSLVHLFASVAVTMFFLAFQEAQP